MHLLWCSSQIFHFSHRFGQLDTVQSNDERPPTGQTFNPCLFFNFPRIEHQVGGPRFYVSFEGWLRAISTLFLLASIFPFLRYISQLDAVVSRLQISIFAASNSLFIKSSTIFMRKNRNHVYHIQRNDTKPVVLNYWNVVRLFWVYTNYG